MRSLNPVLTIGRQLTEVLRRHQKLDRRRGAPARHRAPGDRRHTDGREAARRLSAPVLRRHAPARDDRHRALLQSAPADRRRGDDGARRHHPGADHRPGEAPDARARHVGDLDQPRPRRGRRPVRPRQRHVCRPRRRIGADPRAVPPAEPRLHAGPDGLDAARRRLRGAPPDADRGPAAQPDRSASRSARSCRAAAFRSPPARRGRREPRQFGAGHWASCLADLAP